MPYYLTYVLVSHLPHVPVQVIERLKHCRKWDSEIRELSMQVRSTSPSPPHTHLPSSSPPPPPPPLLILRLSACLTALFATNRPTYQSPTARTPPDAGITHRPTTAMCLCLTVPHVLMSTCPCVHACSVSQTVSGTTQNVCISQLPPPPHPPIHLACLQVGACAPLPTRPTIQPQVCRMCAPTRPPALPPAGVPHVRRAARRYRVSLFQFHHYLFVIRSIIFYLNMSDSD